MEVFAIDEQSRYLIRKNEIEKNNFYLEKSFYVSTRRKYSYADEPTSYKWIQFRHRKSDKLFEFRPLSYSQIKDLIEINPNTEG